MACPRNFYDCEANIKEGKDGTLAMGDLGVFDPYCKIFGVTCKGAIEILPAIYDNIEEYPHTPYMQLCKDGKVGLHGTTLPIPPIYDAVYVPQHFGWIKVKHHGLWGYINSKGEFTENINEAFLYHSNCCI